MPTTSSRSAASSACADAVFVGHSVSAMIGALASIKAPELFESLVMVGPSPRYIDDGDYVGGFSAAQIEELLDFAGRQPHGLVGGDGAGDHGQSGPAGAGRGARPTASAAPIPRSPSEFARVTFTSDNRADLPQGHARAR